MNKTWRILAVVAVIALVGGWWVPADAQPCTHIEAQPADATLTVTGGAALSMGSPANFCDLQPGIRYMLTVSRPGYETRRLKFLFEDYDRPPEISGMATGKVFRSMLFPGWGQVKAGHPWQTVETIAFLGADAMKVYQIWEDYDDVKDEHADVSERIKSAGTQEQLETLVPRGQILAEKANALRESVWLTAGVGGWVYLQNVIETYLLTAGPGVTLLEESGFSVSTPRRSAARAALRSIFFPGLGQHYAGKESRAFLFRTGVFVLAMFTIDAKLHYDLASIEYDAAIERYDAAGSVYEKEALLGGVEERFRNMEDCENKMYRFVIATGSLWLANVLDAIVSGGGNDEKNGRFEFSTSLRGSTVESGIRVRF